MIMTLFFFILTAFVANVIVRDDETGFGPIIRSTRRQLRLPVRPLHRRLRPAALFLAVPLAMLIGSLMPWVDPEVLGPYDLGHFAFASCGCLPALFLTSALLHARHGHPLDDVDLRRRLAFLVVYLVRGSCATRVMNRVALVDPFGLAAFDLPPAIGPPPSATRAAPTSPACCSGTALLWVGVAFALLGRRLRPSASRPRAAAARARRKRRHRRQRPPRAPSGGAAQRSRRACGLDQLWRARPFEMAAVSQEPRLPGPARHGPVEHPGARSGRREFYGAASTPSPAG